MKTTLWPLLFVSVAAFAGPGCVTISPTRPSPGFEITSASPQDGAPHPGPPAAGCAVPGVAWYAATLSGLLPASELAGFLLDVLALPVTYPAYWATGGDEDWAFPFSRSVTDAWIELLEPEQSERPYDP